VDWRHPAVHPERIAVEGLPLKLDGFKRTALCSFSPDPSTLALRADAQGERWVVFGENEVAARTTHDQQDQRNQQDQRMLALPATSPRYK